MNASKRNLDYALLDALKSSGLWGIRTSNDGIGYGEYVHAPVGEWGECPRWTDQATCEGGGFFMQGPGGGEHGYAQPGARFEFVETGPDRKSIDGDKIAARRMRILYTGVADALAALSYVCADKTFPGCLDLRDCTLPAGLVIGNVGGSLNLSGCTLPAGLVIGNVGGCLDLRGCTLPAGLVIGNVGGSLNLSGCTLPAGLVIGNVGGWLYLRGCTLPAGLVIPPVGGCLDLRGCTLPDGRSAYGMTAAGVTAACAEATA